MDGKLPPIVDERHTMRIFVQENEWNNNWFHLIFLQEQRQWVYDFEQQRLMKYPKESQYNLRLCELFSQLMIQL